MGGGVGGGGARREGVGAERGRRGNRRRRTGGVGGGRGEGEGGPWSSSPAPCFCCRGLWLQPQLQGYWPRPSPGQRETKGTRFSFNSELVEKQQDGEKPLTKKRRLNKFEYKKETFYHFRNRKFNFCSPLSAIQIFICSLHQE